MSISRRAPRTPTPSFAESTWPPMRVESRGSPAGALRTHQLTTCGERGSRSSQLGRVPAGTIRALTRSAGGTAWSAPPAAHAGGPAPRPGATVIATARTEQEQALVRELGASEVVDYSG